MCLVGVVCMLGSSCEVQLKQLIDDGLFMKQHLGLLMQTEMLSLLYVQSQDNKQNVLKQLEHLDTPGSQLCAELRVHSNTSHQQHQKPVLTACKSLCRMLVHTAGAQKAP